MEAVAEIEAAREAAPDAPGRREKWDPARLCRAVEQCAEMVMVTDPDGRIVYVNPVFERVTGWSRDEVIGRTPAIQKSGRHGEDFYREMWEMLRAGKSWRGRLTNRRKDGSLYEEEATISPILDASGEIESYVAVKRDVTRIAADEAETRRRQRMEVLGTLAGGICHDFNNLLMVIGGYTHLLLKDEAASDVARKYACEMRDGVDRAAALTKRLLAFTTRQVIRPVVMDINPVISRLEGVIRRILGDDIDLILDLEPGVANVVADAAQIEEVVRNLVANARDAMPDGGTLVLRTANSNPAADQFVPVAEQVRRPHVMLSVSDTGCGMDEDMLARIFEPFFSTKSIGGGAGLGLATVHEIVKQSGGFLQVSSEVGRGSTFEVHLPSIEEPSSTREPSARADAGVRGEGGVVLLAEGEDSLRLLSTKVLREAGYEVLCARDGLEALEIADRHEGRIDLLLADVVMPHLNGPRLAATLGTRRPELRVILMTGYPESIALDPGQIRDVTFLEKPVSPESLCQIVRARLRGRETRPGRPAPDA